MAGALPLTKPQGLQSAPCVLVTQQIFVPNGLISGSVPILAWLVSSAAGSHSSEPGREASGGGGLAVSWAPMGGATVVH